MQFGLLNLLVERFDPEGLHRPLFRHSKNRKMCRLKDKFNAVRRNPYSIIDQILSYYLEDKSVYLSSQFLEAPRRQCPKQIDVRKKENYEVLLATLTTQGFLPAILHFDIGNLGHFSNNTISAIKTVTSAGKPSS